MCLQWKKFKRRMHCNFTKLNSFSRKQLNQVVLPPKERKQQQQQKLNEILERLIVDLNNIGQEMIKDQQINKVT